MEVQRPTHRYVALFQAGTTRRFIEEATKIAQRDAVKMGLDPAKIRAYRAGFTADDRREIEQSMRTGEVGLVFSTNALEIGIDIGRLDACILAGFPDNIMAARQRIGRAGRSWDKTAHVLFYAMNDAMDQFFVSNIDTFLNHELDEIIIGVDNEELIGKHLPYLLHESGWNLPAAKKTILGDAFHSRATEKTLDAKPIVGRGPFYPKLSIRGSGGGSFKLMYKELTEIGEISETHRFREAYVGAVYVHQGKSYRVKSHGATEVYLEDAEPHRRTDPLFWTQASVPEVLEAQRYGDAIAIGYGKLTIFENYNGYKLIDERDGSVIDEVSENAAVPRNVRAFWLAVEKPAAIGGDLGISMRSFEQLLRIGSGFVIPCDRHDIGTLTQLKQPPASVYLHETIPGGIGIAEKCLEVWRDIVSRGVEIATRCKCSDGCPRCVQPRRMRDAEGVSKSAALAFANSVLRIAAGKPEEVFDPETGGMKRVSALYV